MWAALAVEGSDGWRLPVFVLVVDKKGDLSEIRNSHSDRHDCRPCRFASGAAVPGSRPAATAVRLLLLRSRLPEWLAATRNLPSLSRQRMHWNVNQVSGKHSTFQTTSALGVVNRNQW